MGSVFKRIFVVVVFFFLCFLTKNICKMLIFSVCLVFHPAVPCCTCHFGSQERLDHWHGSPSCRPCERGIWIPGVCKPLMDCSVRMWNDALLRALSKEHICERAQRIELSRRPLAPASLWMFQWTMLPCSLNSTLWFSLWIKSTDTGGFHKFLCPSSHLHTVYFVFGSFSVFDWLKWVNVYVQYLDCCASLLYPSMAGARRSRLKLNTDRRPQAQPLL